MRCKNEIETEVLSLKSSNFLSKSFKILHILRNTTAAQKSAWDFYKSDALAQTNQIKYDCFFCMIQKTKTLFSQDLKLETKMPGTLLCFLILQ